MTSPEPTASRAFFMILTSTPSAGAGSSSTTLSVSMSIRFSSRATRSPSCLCQSSSVASATDSESCGTLTSMIAIDFSRSVFPRLRLSFHRVMKNQRVTRRGSLLLDQGQTTFIVHGGKPLLKLAESLLHQQLLALVVPRHVSARGRSRRRPAGIVQLLVL